MNDAKEEIKSRLAVEDVVGQYIELKRAGRSLKGRSPWGVDKTPSFMVSPEKGIWHDFSAGKGGDIFTFIMEVEGISFREALEKLARQAGVDLSKYHGGNSAVTKKKNRAREALKLTAKYYQACLARSGPVCEYVFYKRNLNRKTISEFKIGYAPENGKALVNVLKKRNFTTEELDVAGLLNRFKTDLFRDRMTIPFIDTNGDVIGFTARILKKGEPKYLNTPETLLFNKSKYIFGLYQAKEAIRRSGFVVIVEGNMDVISSHQAGVKEAVATSGTSMTEQQIKILSNLTSDIRLAYDGDEAGVKATERAIELASKLGVDLTVISDYHGAKDPDELIQKDPKLWQKAVEKKEPAVEWLLNKYKEKLDLSLATDKRKYSDIALRLIDKIEDELEKESYEKLVAKRLDTSVEKLREKEQRIKKNTKAPRKFFKEPKTKIKSKTIEKIEKNLLALKIFGGITKTKIPLEVPEEEIKLDELELIFNQEHSHLKGADYEKEAAELLVRYNKELNKQKIEELRARLTGDSGDDEIIQEIANLLQSESNLRKT